VLLDALIGFVRERRVHTAMRALPRLSAPRAEWFAMRNGDRPRWRLAEPMIWHEHGLPDAALGSFLTPERSNTTHLTPERRDQPNAGNTDPSIGRLPSPAGSGRPRTRLRSAATRRQTVAHDDPARFRR
jgi:hypothetical protein